MKFLTSYGIAFIITAILAIWLFTGTLIKGGSGEGKGEKSFISMVTGNEEGEKANSGSVGAKSATATTNGGKNNGGGVGVGTSLSGASAEKSANNGDENKEKLQSVRTMLFSEKDMPIEVALRGHTKASATIKVSTQTSGLVEKIHVKKGQSVKKGDLICTLEAGTRQAQVEQAQASLEQAKASLAQVQADFATNKTLREKGLLALNTARSFEVQLQAAKSSLAAANSALKNAEQDLSRTRIHAESSGLIQDPLANIGDMMNVGSSCATIVQLDPMLFKGKVAEAKVGLLQNGMSAKIQTINLPPIKGFTNFKGKLRYISSIADEATRSFDVEIEIANPNGKIRSGQTASAVIVAGIIKAHLIPQSALTLNSDGIIGVKIVDQANKVHFVEVSIIKDNSEGVFVIGLPKTATIIIFGQEYVIDGQIVDPRLDGQE